MKKIQIRSAFTMVELVFVIAVLGIVASIGAGIIAQMYSGYIYQRAAHRASIKTEIAALQIANRLTNAIPGTVVVRPNIGALTTFTPIDENPNPLDEVLQWVGADADSFESMKNNTNRLPGWSGFCDVQASTKNNILSPGTNKNIARSVINNLSRPNVKWLFDTALFFAGDNTFTANNIGYLGGAGNNGVSTVTNNGGGGVAAASHIILDNVAVPRTISENYKMAWTSYALVPTVADINGNFDLELWYNFQPWDGIFINDGIVLKRVLVRNISLFKFQGIGNSIRFKICAREQTATGEFTSICKEKAVIR